MNFIMDYKLVTSSHLFHAVDQNVQQQKWPQLVQQTQFQNLQKYGNISPFTRKRKWLPAIYVRSTLLGNSTSVILEHWKTYVHNVMTHVMWCQTRSGKIGCYFANWQTQIGWIICTQDWRNKNKTIIWIWMAHFVWQVSFFLEKNYIYAVQIAKASWIASCKISKHGLRNKLLFSQVNNKYGDDWHEATLHG